MVVRPSSRRRGLACGIASLAILATVAASPASAQSQQQNSPNASQGLGQLFSSLGGSGDSALANPDTWNKIGSLTQQTIDVLDNVIGPADEYFIGRRIAGRLIADKAVLDPTDPRAQYVSRIGTALALGSNAPYLYNGYHFVLVDDGEVNAFATPGGFVILTTGMLKFLQNEEELAAVLGHELGHVELEHGMIAVNQAKTSNLFADVGKTGADIMLNENGENPALSKLAGSLFDEMFTAIKNGYSADIEAEADRRGMALAARLGYDPFALVGLLERFKSFKGSYGGAGYPTERAGLARAFLAENGYRQEPADPKRTERFLAMQPSWDPPTGPAVATASASPFGPRANAFAGSGPMRPVAANRSAAPAARLYFAHGSSRLSGADRRRLQEVARQWRSRGGRIKVVGHANRPTGARDPFNHNMANFTVSLQRTARIRDTLVGFGIDRRAIEVTALSDLQPAPESAGSPDAAANRRAEIYLVN